MKNKRLEERRKRIPKDVDLYVERSFQIVDRIYQILSDNGKDQKWLAKALGKSESEISKWMTGTHNFTLKSLSKIEVVLRQSILEVTANAKVEDKITFIDQFIFTLPNKQSRKKTTYPTENIWASPTIFHEPSEILS